MPQPQKPTIERIREALKEDENEDKDSFYHDNVTLAIDDLYFWRGACQMLLEQLDNFEQQI